MTTTHNLLLVADELITNIPDDLIYAVTLNPTPPTHNGSKMWPNIEVALKKKPTTGAGLEWVTSLPGVQDVDLQLEGIYGKLDGADFLVRGFA